MQQEQQNEKYYQKGGRLPKHSVTIKSRHWETKWNHDAKGHSNKMKKILKLFTW